MTDRRDIGNLLLDPVPGAGLVSVCLALPGPEFCEKKDTLGFVGWWMELLRSGAGVIAEEEIGRRFDEWGSGLSSFCTDSVAGLTYSCLPDALEDSLGLLSRLFSAEKEIPRRMLDRERAARIALIREESDDPASDGLRRMRRRLLGEKPLAYSPLGRIEDLKRGSSDSILDLRRTVWSKGSLAIALSGDFDHGWAERRVGELFPRAVESTEILSKSSSATVSLEPFEEVVRHSREQSVVVNAFRVGGITDENARSRLLALSCLNGLAGPLFEEIRERHGLAYYCGARLVAGLEEGLIAFVSGCEESQSRFLMDRMGEILLRLGVRGFSEDEWESGQSQIRSSLLMSRQRTSWRCQRLAFRCIQGLQPDLGEGMEDFLSEVNPTKIQEWSAIHLKPANGSTMFLLPKDGENGC